MFSRVPSKTNSLFILNEKNYEHYWFSPQYNLIHSMNKYLLRLIIYQHFSMSYGWILSCTTLFSLNLSSGWNRADKQQQIHK